MTSMCLCGSAIGLSESPPQPPHLLDSLSIKEQQEVSDQNPFSTQLNPSKSTIKKNDKKKGKDKPKSTRV